MINAIVIGLVIGLGLTALSAYRGTFDKNYDFSPPQISMDNFLTATLPNGEPINASLNFQIKLDTTSLSAQNPITITGYVYPSEKYREVIPNQWKTMPDKIGLVLPKAKLFDENKSTSDFVLIELMKQNNSKTYYGTQKIMYTFEGDYGYFFMTPNEMDKYTENGFMYLTNTYMNSHIFDSEIYHVGGADETINLRQNGIFLALTFVFVAFALIESRTHLIDLFIYVLYMDKNKQTQ